MKKITRILIGQIIIQPLFVFILRGHLLAAVPVHYQLLTANLLNTIPQRNLTIAMGEAMLAPLLILACRHVSINVFIPPVSRWIFTPKTTWLWWLFGLNWFILLSLFISASWLTWLWAIWTVIFVGQLFAYMMDLIWRDHSTQR